MDGQCLLPNTVLPSKFDGLNFDGLAGKRQNRQNFLLYGTIVQRSLYGHTTIFKQGRLCSVLMLKASNNASA